MRFSEFKTGMSKSMQKVVTEKDTAHYYGSGALKELLATPVLTALMIETAVSLVDPLLPDEYISIGRTFSIEHIQPTVLGMTVTVEASISEIENNRIALEIKAYDELGLIGKGYHERYIVKYNSLMEKVQHRCDPLNPRP